MSDLRTRVFVPEQLALVVAVHAVTVLVAPFLFTWQAFAFAWLAAMVFGYALGIFHHMLLSHRSFATPKWLEHLGATLGTLSWRGPMAGPIRYAAMHRIHHAHSDQEDDPHSPIHGTFHALLGWYWRLPRRFTDPTLYEPLAPTLAADPVLRRLDRHPHLAQAAWGALAFVIGGLVGAAPGFDWTNALRFVVYGVFVKTFLIIYLANAVDLVNHSIGYRNYATTDRSTNSWLMAAIHLGGAISWHNNHHAHPAYFTVKRRWWELDVHYALLKGLERAGLVSKIKVLDERAAG